MGRTPSPSFRVTLVMEIEDEICSLVLVSGGTFAFPAFAEIEATTPVKLLEAHVTRIAESRQPPAAGAAPRSDDLGGSRGAA